MVGIIPQIVKLVRIILQIIEFADTVSVVDTDLVSTIPIHRRKAAVRQVESIVKLAAHELAKIVRAFPLGYR